jgi:uncharacterized protein
MRVAVIGSGISGLSAAYFISRRHEVHLFEAESRLGGHTHTHLIETSQGPQSIDTGFIVHNDRTYPNFIRLMAELGIERENSDMSWGVTCPRTGIEYSSRGLPGFFASRRRLLVPSQWQLLADILRFNRQAQLHLTQSANEAQTLGHFIAEGRYSQIFQDYYLYPTVAAIWSTAPARVLEFPAATLFRFFQNHGLLAVTGHPQWMVLRGGSSRYIDKLIHPLANRVFTSMPIRSITRSTEGVEITPQGSEALSFDAAVLATHGPQALAILSDADPLEREVLGNFQTSNNEACLHTDARVLPRRRDAWASWNYAIQADKGVPATLTYHMNRLQNLTTPEQYCVTLNSTASLDPTKILRRLRYQHPLYTLNAVRAQARWAEISGRRGVHFCGAYWANGFHEDGLRSGMRVAEALGVECQIL